MSVLHKVRKILDRKAKIKILFLVIGVIGAGLFEVATLATISPFISVILDPTIIERNQILKSVYGFFGFRSVNTFLGFLAFSLTILYVVRGSYVYVLNRIKYRFTSRQQVALSDRMLRIVLNKPYAFHTSKNLAELQRMIIGDVSSFNQLINTILALATDMFMSFFILIFLFTTSVSMTISILSLSLFCIFIYFKLFREKIKETGVENRKRSVKMIKSVQQGLGGVKEVKVLNKEDYFANEFKKNSTNFAIANQRYQVYSTIPKLLIESVCFGGAFVSIGFMVMLRQDLEAIVPQLSMFVLAAFRLLPAVTRFTGYINTVMYNMPSIDAVYNNIVESEKKSQTVEFGTTDIVSKDIIVDHITFAYSGMEEPVLEDVSLTITGKESTAFIGATGAGKTTLADIILGLYPPQKGNVFFNGKAIHANPVEWTNHIGYIPQQIYLFDESILENIAFGYKKEEIDEKRVWDVVEKAQLKDFVESLPERLNTVVGDRGVRLSGGQRQRIGIARALYKNPDILVLDEATSALDNDTEKAVMDAIESLSGDKTLIVIAHRLSTIEHCNSVFKVEGKKVTKVR